MLSVIPKVLIVTAVAIPLLYALYCLVAGRLVRVEPYPLVLYMSGAFLVMSILEAGLGQLHTQLFGWRLWEYLVFPNHGGYGSDLGPITWPWYGFHVYLLGQAMEHRGMPRIAGRWKGLFSGVDGPLLEILGNGLFVLLFGQYVFYYYPGDLGHLTSLQVTPYYALAGLILVAVMGILDRVERRWSLPAALYLGGVAFVVAG